MVVETTERERHIRPGPICCTLSPPCSVDLCWCDLYNWKTVLHEDQ